MPAASASDIEAYDEKCKSITHNNESELVLDQIDQFLSPESNTNAVTMNTNNILPKMGATTVSEGVLVAHTISKKIKLMTKF